MMLQDPNLDDVIDAFEAGYADAGLRASVVIPCPFGVRDPVRRAAWVDGASFSTIMAANPTRNGESVTHYAVDATHYGIGAHHHTYDVFFRAAGTRFK